MMTRLILTILFSTFACFGQTNINVIYSFVNGLGQPQTVKQVSFTPLSLGLDGRAYVVGDEITRVVTSSSYTNPMISGFAYRVKYFSTIQPPTVTAIFTNYFSTNVSGMVYASDYTALSTNLGNGLYAYSQAAADARFALIGSGGAATNIFFGDTPTIGYTVSGGTNLFALDSGVQTILNQSASTQYVANATALMLTNAVADSNVNVTVTSGVIHIGGLPGGGGGTTIATVTNSPTIQLYPNNIAYDGTWHWFFGSKSAGLNEIQQLYPRRASGTNVSGIVIELAHNATFPFTGQIGLSNNITIRGGGFAGSRLLYVGPTNIFTYSQVTNAFDYDTILMGGTMEMGCGVSLVSLNRSSYTTDGESSNPQISTFNFEGFSIQVSTNMPCVLLGGICQNLFLEKVGLFGPDVFASGAANYSTLNPIEPSTITQAPAVVGTLLEIYGQSTTRNCYAMELADGFTFIGNSWSDFENNQVYCCGVWNHSTNWSNAYTNSPGSMLSVGYGNYQSLNCYSDYCAHNADYKNHVSEWHDDQCVIQFTAGQYSQYDVCAGSYSDGGVYGNVLVKNCSGITMGAVTYDGSTFSVSTTNIPYGVEVKNQDMVNDALYDTSFYYNGQLGYGFADNVVNNGVEWQFVFGPLVTLYGNGGGLTNLSLSGLQTNGALNGQVLTYNKNTGIVFSNAPAGYTDAQAVAAVSNNVPGQILTNGQVLANFGAISFNGSGGGNFSFGGLATGGQFQGSFIGGLAGNATSAEFASNSVNGLPFGTLANSNSITSNNITGSINVGQISPAPLLTYKTIVAGYIDGPNYTTATPRWFPLLGSLSSGGSGSGWTNYSNVMPPGTYSNLVYQVASLPNGSNSIAQLYFGGVYSGISATNLGDGTPIKMSADTLHSITITTNSPAVMLLSGGTAMVYVSWTLTFIPQ